MTVPVQPPPVNAVAAANAWFSALGRPYLGRLAPDDPLLGGGGGAGWLVTTLGRRLAVVVDPAFPYTRPKVYLRGRWPALPHVEADGRLCLRNPEIPSDPEAAVAHALGAARDLLRAIESGSEDGDFQEDFGLYWRNHAELGSRARLLLAETDNSAVLAWTATGAAVYGFASPEALRRWWLHRFGSERVRSRQGALIALDRLPHPDLYPGTGTELWDLVASGSGDGTSVLGDLLRQTPKRLLIVLAGRAPSGRRHAVGLLLARPPDAKGRPVNRRVIEREHRRGETPPAVLCDRYVVQRLGTDALDAARTRLPYPERDRLAAARVAVVGCGALGSGVARLLARSGVGHLVLIDPEPLGWENIRRHQLGAGAVGLPKATTFAQAVAQENPDIGSARGHDISVERLLVQDPEAVSAVDLVVACTATWSANSALDDQASRGGPPVLFAWMEAYALAAHALLILPGSSYSSGFDEVGNPRMTASVSHKPVPAECGALTSPFGAIELSLAEALTARLALDFLRGKVGDTTWRTWLTNAAALTEADGRWTEDWIEARGAPDPGGQISVGPWWER